MRLSRCAKIDARRVVYIDACTGAALAHSKRNAAHIGMRAQSKESALAA